MSSLLNANCWREEEEREGREEGERKEGRREGGGKEGGERKGGREGGWEERREGEIMRKVRVWKKGEEREY